MNWPFRPCVQFWTDGSGACQDPAVNAPSVSSKLSRVLDRVGLIPPSLLLATGIRDYRDGGSMAWPIGAAFLLVVSLWVVYRGLPQRRDTSIRALQE